MLFSADGTKVNIGLFSQEHNHLASAEVGVLLYKLPAEEKEHLNSLAEEVWQQCWFKVQVNT